MGRGPRLLSCELSHLASLAEVSLHIHAGGSSRQAHSDMISRETMQPQVDDERAKGDFEGVIA
jgi:hypothetical protein